MKHFFLIFSLLCFACSANADEVQTPDSTETQLIGIDLRTKLELLVNPSVNSTHISIFDLKEKITDVIPDKSTPLALFCERGGRSARGYNLLSAMGYTNLTDVKTWREWNALQEKQKANNTENN